MVYSCQPLITILVTVAPVVENSSAFHVYICEHTITIRQNSGQTSPALSVFGKYRNAC